MAIKIINNTIIDNNRNITNAKNIEGFYAVNQQIVLYDTIINNNQENIIFAEDLVINNGITLTISSGSTLTVNAYTAPPEVNLPAGDGRVSNPYTGSIRYNSQSSVLEVYDGSLWRVIASDGRYGVDLNLSSTGFFGNSSNTAYINISSTGNSTYYGALTTARSQLAACSSSTRGVFGGGYLSTPAPGTIYSTIDYINIASNISGDTLTFGSLSPSKGSLAACSSNTRGIFGGGFTAPALAPTDDMDYITIATTGNGITFGILTVARSYLSACSSSTRGVFAGGASGSPLVASNVIDYITIATTGNATIFGDANIARAELAACSSSTRGVFAGGTVGSPAVSNVIGYITIASTGNATDFGDLTVARTSLAACSSSTRGVFGGGVVTPAISGNTIDYITIASTGNATDFGDLIGIGGRYLASFSSCHGGLQ